MAASDSLLDTDYREIYQELRGLDPASGKFALSLRQFATKIASSMSHAVWSKYDRGTMDLSRRMKSELRLAIGMEALPPTVEDALEGVSGDATVACLDEEELNYVLLANCENPLLVGLLKRVEERNTNERRDRKRYVRPAVDPEQDERRDALGVSWRDVIEAGLKALSEE